MPLASRIMIRVALFYFATGAVIGGLMLAEKAVSFFSGIWMLLPVHIELMIFGWIIQFTLGTAYWILPRNLTGKPRGDMKTGLLVPLLLNTGILLALSDYLFLPEGNLINLMMIARIFQLLAVIFFVGLHWRRVSERHEAY